jgi:hypothetical protein
MKTIIEPRRLSIPGLGVRSRSLRRPRSRWVMRAGLLGLVVLSSTSNSTLANPILFPTRASELPAGQFIYSGTHLDGKQVNAIDFHVRRWDTTALEWTREKVGAGFIPAADEYLAYDLPLYAPEDGRVIACFNNYADYPDLLTLPCDNPNGCPDDVFAGGNFIVVLTEDNETAYVLAHLGEGSIPPELCPNEEVTTSNATADCALGGAFTNEGVPETTQLRLVNPEDPMDPYPEVLKGDLIGNIGLTGSVSSVHTHFEVFEIAWDSNDRFCKGPSLPLEFYESWIQAVPNSAASSNWTSMDSTTTLEVGPPVLIYPGAIGATTDDHDYNLDASKLHFTTHSSGGVMAYLDGAGQLDVRSYDVNASGDVVTQSLVNEGGVLDLSVARPNTARSVIVSIRGANDNLKLIPYSVTTLGAITRQVGKEVTEGDIGMVASIKSPMHDGVVVAVENGSGTLEVIDYDVDASLNLSRQTGTGTGGSIDAVELTGLVADFDGVVTVELVAGTNGVRLRSFEVPASGGVTNADTYTSFLAGTQIDIDKVVVTGGDEYVVTSLRLNNGTMRVDVWDIDASGDISWVSTGATGAVSKIDGTSMGPEDYLSSVRDSNNQLRLIGWSVDVFGEIRRNSTVAYGVVSDAVSINSLAESGHIETLYTDTNGELRLLTVEENFASGI